MTIYDSVNAIGATLYVTVVTCHHHFFTCNLIFFHTVSLLKRTPEGRKFCIYYRKHIVKRLKLWGTGL